jgi:hypothetical protein
VSDVERMADLADADLLDMIGPPGSVPRNAAMALAIKSMREGGKNTRDAAERSGRYRAMTEPLELSGQVKPGTAP